MDHTIEGLQFTFKITMLHQVATVVYRHVTVTPYKNHLSVMQQVIDDKQSPRIFTFSPFFFYIVCYSLSGKSCLYHVVECL